MKIAVLGTGVVGRTIASALVRTGNEVAMGSRTADNEAATTWAGEAGADASHGTFARAAEGAEVVVNCTAGKVSIEALSAAGDLGGKVLIDVANALDFSKSPPALLFPNSASLGERIQNAFPGAKVVKALNTMNNEIMVDPALVPGNHDVFICGNDAGAKGVVRQILNDFGWKDDRIVDLGDITNARSLELWLSFWLSLMGALGTPRFNIKIVR